MREPRRPLREATRRPLDMLVRVPGLIGALLMTRDGRLVVSEMSRVRTSDTFVAMAAAAVTAGEVMAVELDLAGPLLFRIDHPRLTLAGMGVSDDLVVVAFAEPGTPVDAVFSRLGNGAAVEP